MITGEQIKQCAVSCGFKLTNETCDDLKPYVYEFARDLIALAQQVKPLEFAKVDRGTYYAKAFPFGGYSIKDCGNNNWYVQITFRNFFIDVCIDKILSFDEAVEVAQQDYQRRVLSRLVHGGV